MCFCFFLKPFTTYFYSDDDLSELATEMGITGGVSVPDTSCAMKTTESDKLKSDIIGEKKKAMGNEL